MGHNLLSQFLTSLGASRKYRLALMLPIAILLFLASSPAGAEVSAKATGEVVEPEVGESILVLEVKNNLIDLQAEEASFKEILRELEKKSGIKVHILEGLDDHKISLNIKALPIYAVDTLLEKMSLRNYAVVYDKDSALEIYIHPEGKDIADLISGKSVIRRADFRIGKYANTIKNKNIAAIDRGQDRPQIRYVEDEILLKFHLGVTDKEIDNVLSKYGLEKLDDESLLKIGYIKVRPPAGKDLISTIKEIRNDYKIKISDLNYVLDTLSIQDPLYNDQWYIPETKFDEAWKQADSKSIVKVAVIDSGVDHTHFDLNNKITQGFDFVNNDTDTSDDHGHGTFVSGIIAASSNKIGIKGLYDNARIIPVKVIDSNGLGTYEDTAKGIIYAADNGAKVINLSIGGYGYSFMLKDAVDYALEQGCIVVAAGGNDGIEQEIYPAAYPDVIGVSALGYNGQIWSGSNSGRHIDVSAPGVDIISTGISNSYVYASGTSASAPMVSALTAMLVSEKSDLSSSFVARLISQTAKDLGEKGRDKIYGSGKIDALKALKKKIKPFHDVAVRSVSVEPKIFEKGKPTYIIAEVENTGTYVSEKCDVVLYRIVGEEKKEIGRKDAVTAIDKLEVIFEWKPEKIEENIKFEVSIFSENDTDSSNNTKASHIFYLEESDGLYLLHKVDPPVHQWIAYQAKDIWVTSEIVSYIEKNDYSNVWSSQTDSYCDTSGYLSSEGILVGACEEDKDTFEALCLPLGNPFCWHFWEPDSPQNGDYNDGIAGYSSAYTRAQNLWDNYVIPNYPSDKNKAYYWLGRVAHLIVDMTTPAHVHKDQHLTNDDEYEEFVSGNQHDNAWGDGINYQHFSGANYQGQQYDYKSVFDGSVSCPSCVKTNPSNLFKLFWYTAQKTQYFASDDWDAISDDGYTGDYNNYFSYESGTTYYFSGGSSNTYLWDAEGGANIIVNNKSYIEDFWGDGNVANLKKIAEANIPHAMKAVAGLYKLFWEETHPDDSYEENDTQNDAKTISAPFNNSSLMLYDLDWYKIYVSSGNTLTASIDFTHSNGDLDLKLYDSSGNQLDISDETLNQETVSHPVTATGYYYIYVYGFNDAENTYSMNVSVTANPVNGSCGSSDGQTFTSKPTSGLCSSGSSGTVSGSGPWSWSCSGSNGGSTANCSASIRTWTVTPSAGAGGSISPSSAQSVTNGSTKSFTVSPYSGYSISSVGGTCGGSLSGSTYTTNAITSNCSVSAMFTANPVNYTLSVIRSGSGTVSSSPSGISCGSDCLQSYTSGTTVTLTALASNGYSFSSWSGCSSTLGNTCYVIMNSAKSVTANFSQDSTPSLDVTYPNGGESLTKETNYTITWTSSNVTGNVQIDLYKGSSNYLQLAASDSNDGSYPFTPLNSFPDGIDYRVCMSAMSGTVFNCSGYFTISGESSDLIVSADGLWYEVLDTDAPTGRTVASLSAKSWWYGQDATGNYDTGAANNGSIITSPIVIGTSSQLQFSSWEHTEDTGVDWDQRLVYISVDSGNTWTLLKQLTTPQQQWYQVSIDLSSYAGQTAIFKFTFDTVDDFNNANQGWYVDDIEVVGPGASKALTGLTISGSSSVDESSAATYTATASWSDVTTSTVTPTWSENSAYASISTGGVLTTDPVTSDQSLTITASYTSGGVTKTATKTVSITNVVTLPDVSNPDPADGATVTAGASGQLLRVKALGATSGVIYYDDDSAISFSISATINGDYLEATIPYASGKMKNIGTNYWYVEATNSGGTTRYPASGNLSFTVIKITCPDTGTIQCLERADGGDDSNNLDTSTGNPKADIEYRFELNVKDTTGNPPQYIKLYMSQRYAPAFGDFYTYDMTCSGDYAIGATCTYTTKLGPAAVHKFYFEAKMFDSTVLKYPESGYITGPTVQLVTGNNTVGTPRDINSANLDGLTAFGSEWSYRWDSALGYYTKVTLAEPALIGEGYFVLNETTTLPEHGTLGEVQAPSFTYQLQTGWNIISNPYAGNVKLSDIMVQKGLNAPVTWLDAITNSWLTDAIYYYNGSDWGKTYSFETKDDGAVLVPWIGYWIELKVSDDTYSIVIPKP